MSCPLVSGLEALPPSSSLKVTQSVMGCNQCYITQICLKKYEVSLLAGSVIPINLAHMDLAYQTLVRG